MFKRLQGFWATGLMSGVLFCVLLGIKTGVLHPAAPNNQEAVVRPGQTADRDTWMSIYQARQKVGYTHSTLRRHKDGYAHTEQLHLRVNTLGLMQTITMETTSQLNSDFSLDAFEFTIDSGRFTFKADGAVFNDKLSIRLQGLGEDQEMEVPVARKIYMAGSIADRISLTGFDPGAQQQFDIFDPVTLGRLPVTVTIKGKETVRLGEKRYLANRALIEFKGTQQTAWISDAGEILKERGFLGMSLQKTTADKAKDGLTMKPGEDLAVLASVDAGRRIDQPANLKALSIDLHGIDAGKLRLTGGRQVFKKNRLFVTKERIDKLTVDPTDANKGKQRYLRPEAMIQSENHRIKQLVAKLTTPQDSGLQKVRRIADWIYTNIEKRPVLSVPNALDTLHQRVGDCNEHAVLFAAMARAAGIPTRVEAGLAYLDGRFYYHAWNGVYLGRWITVDTVFNQLPADVTHLRFSEGVQQLQHDLLGVMGKIKLTIVDLQS